MIISPFSSNVLADSFSEAKKKHRVVGTHFSRGIFNSGSASNGAMSSKSVADVRPILLIGRIHPISSSPFTSQLEYTPKVVFLFLANQRLLLSDVYIR